MVAQPALASSAQRRSSHRSCPSGPLACFPAAAQIAGPLEPIIWTGVNLLPRVYLAEQDKREGGVIWSLCIYTLYEHESGDSDPSLPCSGSSLGQLDLATDMTRQTGDEELSPPAGLAISMAV